MDPSAKYHKPCIIVGGGVGGLIQAAELLRKKVFSLHDIRIFEQNQDYGGVWKAATYPGAACDVFSCTYQISWHRNPDWDSLFPSGSELVRYYQNFAAHFKLPTCTLFQQSVVQASWSEERSLWVVDVEDISSGKVTSWTCRILIQAAGTYNRKNVPNIPGLDTFKGEVWHTADWPQQYDFTGKRVAYVGTGPTFVQVLPHLQQQASSLNVFCRSLTYCHPFTNFTYPKVVKRAFRWIPGLMGLYAFIVAWSFAFWAYLVFRPSTWLAKHTERSCRRHLAKEISDPILREKLQPPGRFGSKRPLVSLSGFFKTVQERNVHLISDPIVSIDETGVITSPKPRGNAIRPLDGDNTVMATDPAKPVVATTHTQADVLLLGTGFIMQGWGGAIPTTGRHGLLLTQHWADYPVSLYGTMTSSFPNLLLVNGPNTTSPWASLIRSLELQAMHNTHVIRHIVTQSKTHPNFALEPSQEKEAAWVEAMQPELDTLATSPRYGPAFYYLNAQGRNTFFWPWSQSYYWWRVRKFKKADYVEIQPGTNARKEIV